MTLQLDTNVASTVAKYFSDNFQAVTQSSALNLPALNATPPQSWLDANANKKFVLTPTNKGSYDLNEISPDEHGSYRALAQGEQYVTAGAAYAIRNANTQNTGVDWVMNQIADEFLRQSTLQTFGPLLTTAPEANLQFDLASLDSASLIRLLNLLTGRNRDTMVEVAKGNSQDTKDSLSRLGLAAAALSKAMDLQTSFQTQASSTDTEGTFDHLTALALSKLTQAASSDLAASRLAAYASVTGRQDSQLLNRLAQWGFAALNTQLQAAADIAYTLNPDIARFLSDLDVQQTHDGYVVKSQATVGREAYVAALQADLSKTLNHPQLALELADALATHADALNLSHLTLPEQTELLQDVARAVVAAAASNTDYVQGLASRSVALHSDIAALLRNEITAASERDAVAQNV